MKLNELELPGGEIILAEYFREKSELMENLYSNKNMEDDLRNKIKNNSADKNGRFLSMQQNDEQGGLINTFKTFLNQQDQYKNMTSTPFSTHMVNQSFVCF